MQLHWDGNNTMVEERNKSAAFGTGTTPPTIDLAAIGRIEDWLLDAGAAELSVSRSTRPRPARGAAIYKRVLRRLSRRDAAAATFSGEYVGKVTPQSASDDRHRSPPARLLHVRPGGQPGDALRRLSAWRFTPFPQDLRLRQHAARRPVAARAVSAQRLGADAARSARAGGDAPPMFYRGNDVYDPTNVGFVSDVAEEGGRKLFRVRHQPCPAIPTPATRASATAPSCSADDKDALVEYLKTF